jgi:hypothetical protein
MALRAKLAAKSASTLACPAALTSTKPWQRIRPPGLHGTSLRSGRS